MQINIGRIITKRQFLIKLSFLFKFVEKQKFLPFYNYLEQTKNKIKESINNTGGKVDDDTPFDDYYTQVQHIIDTTVIPQDTVNQLANLVLDINGEEV